MSVWTTLDHRLYLQFYMLFVLIFVDWWSQISVTNDMENLETQTDAMNENNPLLTEVPFPSCRLMLCIMGFLGCINVYCLQVNLSVALVAMVNSTQQPYVNVSHNASDSNMGDICEASDSTVKTVKADMKSGEFDWDSNTQGTVLGAFFYGYLTTQV